MAAVQRDLEKKEVDHLRNDLEGYIYSQQNEVSGLTKSGVGTKNLFLQKLKETEEWLSDTRDDAEIGKDVIMGKLNELQKMRKMIG